MTQAQSTKNVVVQGNLVINGTAHTLCKDFGPLTAPLLVNTPKTDFENDLMAR